MHRRPNATVIMKRSIKLGTGMKHYLILTAIAFYVLLAPCAPARAGIIEVTEVMMESQGLLAVGLGIALGPDDASPLHFTSSVDPLGKTFGYDLVAGSNYLGLAASLSVDGSFDAFSQMLLQVP